MKYTWNTFFHFPTQTHDFYKITGEMIMWDNDVYDFHSLPTQHVVSYFLLIPCYHPWISLDGKGGRKLPLFLCHPLSPLHAPYLQEPLDPENPRKADSPHIALPCIQVSLSPFSRAHSSLRPRGNTELQQREQNLPVGSPSSQVPALPSTLAGLGVMDSQISSEQKSSEWKIRFQ